MTRGKQTTALALAGAVALASGAYALGSQANDGSAEAAKSAAPTAPRGFFGRGFVGRGPDGPGFGHHGGPGPGARFDGLADRLGVSEEKLRTAVADIAKANRDEFATRLADALNIDAAKVRQAFENLRPKRPDHPRAPRAFAAALAKELGISAAKIRAVLEQHRNDRIRPDDLAKDLGVSDQKLQDAFHAVFDKLRPRGPGRPGLDNLAQRLGVTQQQLDDAFEKLRAQRDDLRDQFAQELAKRLGLDPSKVQQALEESRPLPPRRP